MAVKIGIHVNDGPVGRVQQTVVRESRLEQVEQIGHETDVAGRISGYFDVHIRQRPQSTQGAGRGFETLPVDDVAGVVDNHGLFGNPFARRGEIG